LLHKMTGLVPPAKSKALARLYWSLVVSTAFAVLLVVATIWFAALRQAEDEWVRHTLSVRNQIARVLTLVERAESGQRGYLLTGREMYLAPYERAIQELPAALDEMGVLVADNPLQQQSVERVRQLTIDKLRELRGTIDARRAGNAEGALAIVNDNSGQRMMDEIRRLVAAMELEENRLFTQRQMRAATFGALLGAGAGAAPAGDSCRRRLGQLADAAFVSGTRCRPRPTPDCQ
jgi:CHASE3 domain sensor protein